MTIPGQEVMYRADHGRQIHRSTADGKVVAERLFIDDRCLTTEHLAPVRIEAQCCQHSYS